MMWGSIPLTGAAPSCLSSQECGFTATHLTSAGVSCSLSSLSLPAVPCWEEHMCSILESEVGPVFTGLCWFPMQIITLTRGGPFLLLDLPGTPICTLHFYFYALTASEIGKLLAEAQRWLLCDQPLC